jgi:hypothetical protein
VTGEAHLRGGAEDLDPAGIAIVDEDGLAVAELGCHLEPLRNGYEGAVDDAERVAEAPGGVDEDPQDIDVDCGHLRWIRRCAARR